MDPIKTISDLATPSILVTLLVFLASYAIIISEKIHRTTVALFGGAFIIFVGTIWGFYNQDEAIAAIDFNTLGLLVGMMVLAAIAKDTGLFQYLAVRAAKISKGDPWRIMMLFAVITAVFSAFLDNVTTVLLLVPMTFVICNNLKINPIPFLIVEIIASNIGGAATLIGDPPNVLIGSAAGFSFVDFLLNMTPVSVIIFGLVMVYFRFTYAKHLTAKKEHMASIMQLNERDAISDVVLMKKFLFVLGLTIIGFFIHGALHIEAATIALAGAGLLLALDNKNPERALKEVEWTSIFFFIGLFTLVGSIEAIGVIEYAASQLTAATQGSVAATASVLLWGSAFFSAIVDNIPFATAMIPLVHEMSATFTHDQLNTIWWSLALGAALGGNATIVGASANMVVAGLADKSGYHISFKEYLKVGVVATIISIAVSQVYVMVRYL